jgi:SNF2 family DNA or RNA helicase
VLTWKPGTEALVKARLRSHCVIAEAKKKEWAAILPLPKERFHSVDLTPKQMEVYYVILNEVIEKVQLDAQTNDTLRRLLLGKALDENGDEVDSDVSIDGLLNPYLARLEQFLTAPTKDTIGAAMLTAPEDQISPKALKIVELCRLHEEEKKPGKCLIFTNYTDSAEAIYEAFPPAMKANCILYSASNKEECLASFEKDASKRFMVGVEASLNTGGNLQFCDQLQRCETVWTPGVLEQGNARIGRPNIKEKEGRSEIFYEWIISNKTIDVTKISYLMSKTISKAKFDEAGNSRFDTLEVPPLFSMTLDTIRASNDFNESMLNTPSTASRTRISCSTLTVR